MESYDGASFPAGNQRDPLSFDKRHHGELHMVIGPDTIQIGDTCDHNNRRLVHLQNVPLGYNYIAPQINDGEEFAIGGDRAHIIKILADHLQHRSDENWHIVGIPESHLRNLAAGASSSSMAVPGQCGPPRKKMKRRLKAETAEAEKQLGIWQNVLYPAGRQGQQLGFPPQTPGAFGQGGGPAQGYMQGQQSFGYTQQNLGCTQQGNLGGLSYGTGGAPWFPPDQKPGPYQQGNASAFGQGGAPSTAPKTTWAQYDALAPGAEVFYKPEEDDWIFQDPGLAFNQPNNTNNDLNLANAGVSYNPGGDGLFFQDRGLALGQPNKMGNNPNTASDGVFYKPGEDDWFFQDQGLAPSQPDSITNSFFNAAGAGTTPQARGGDPLERFDDKSGTGRCDWCGRHGHEAVDCVRWDPEHFDKAVCVACNNVLHGIDECPKFNQMGREARAALVLDRGARRPGVRSTYNPWTGYCTRDYWGRGFPMSRGFLRRLAGDGRAGPVFRNLWKVLDYRRPLPREFHDPDLDSVKKIVQAGLDESFQDGMPPSVYGRGGSAAPTEADEDEVGDEDEVEDDAEGESVGDYEMQL